jgi:hypothetical protein
VLISRSCVCRAQFGHHFISFRLPFIFAPINRTALKRRVRSAWYFDDATVTGPNRSVNFKMSLRPFAIMINNRLSFFSLLFLSQPGAAAAAFFPRETEPQESREVAGPNYAM